MRQAGRQSARENNETEPNAFQEALRALREKLYALHKALIDSERVEYESSFGAIATPNQFLRLLIDDPWFAWLRPFSALIAEIDERLDAEEPLTKANLDKIKEQASVLLKASEEGDTFERSYYESLQRTPDVVLAHAAVIKLLRPERG